ncbi:histidine phosphatase family protein [Nocardioides sp.]|uniref:SixA phosphatase family protein n=1 Tax=Nocardioides sp. TaxID=35761 RepID=UPI0035277B4E
MVSPAQRARTTWELVGAELPLAPPVRVEDDLYAFGAGPLLAVVRRLPGEATTVALVGHNPALEELVEELTGEWVAMPTSALAVLELPGAWVDAGEAPRACSPPAAHPDSPPRSAPLRGLRLVLCVADYRTRHHPPGTPWG